ncbi:MAG: NADH:ubiquinone reductase (Na(+)-transporting) subunit C [Bacteroidales bacterium]|jgi:Na+-transporting NADH:ubiquinone oxidoreductase subunit C|nr:NADH:ubiquinone reductase (Na(+)-transporting) subunit C [Bacteroidales bacterium]
MFSNKYIFVYSTILVVLAAAILSIAAVALKPFQEKNIKIEKMQQLLACVGIESTPKNAESLYNKFFTQEVAVNAKGEIEDDYSNGRLQGNKRPFDLVVKEQLDKAKSGDQSAVMPVYICTKDGRKTYVVPVSGNGLWGGIWGNVALGEDLSTIVGVNFDHKGETPGLGAEITTKAFQQQFNGKTIFDNTTFKSVSVEKRADKNDPHAVDAISGGTITSQGVSSMLYDCLSFYIPYLNNNKTK